MARGFGVWVVLGALLLSSATGYAAEHGGSAMSQGGAKYSLSLTKDYTPSPWTSEVGYTNRAIGKLGFGVKNLLLGWTEIFTEPKASIDEGSNFFVGLGKGLLNGVGQTLGGAVHLATFPVTCVDAPLPEGGTQIL